MALSIKEDPQRPEDVAALFKPEPMARQPQSFIPDHKSTQEPKMAGMTREEALAAIVEPKARVAPASVAPPSAAAAASGPATPHAATEHRAPLQVDPRMPEHLAWTAKTEPATTGSTTAAPATGLQEHHGPGKRRHHGRHHHGPGRHGAHGGHGPLPHAGLLRDAHSKVPLPPPRPHELETPAVAAAKPAHAAAAKVAEPIQFSQAARPGMMGG